MSFFFIELYKIPIDDDVLLALSSTQFSLRNVVDIIIDYMSDKWLSRSIIDRCQGEPFEYLRQWIDDPYQQRNNPLYVSETAKEYGGETGYHLNALFGLIAFQQRKILDPTAWGYTFPMEQGQSVVHYQDCIIGFYWEGECKNFEIIVDGTQFTQEDCTEITVTFVERLGKNGEKVIDHRLGCAFVMTPKKILTIKNVFPFNCFKDFSEHTIQLSGDNPCAQPKLVPLCLDIDSRRFVHSATTASNYVKHKKKELEWRVCRLNQYLKVIHNVCPTTENDVLRSYYDSISSDIVPFPMHISKNEQMGDMVMKHYETYKDDINKLKTW
jgi:hypothetical protein